MTKGRIIEVHRHYNGVQMAQQDPQVIAWQEQRWMAIGPYWDGKVPASGLTFEEQRVLLPELLGIEPTDKDFRKEVNNFYHNILTRVPASGLKLQIGLEQDAEPMSNTNMPLSLKDYITYRHVLKSPDVANGKDNAVRYGYTHFYIVDPQNNIAQAHKTNKLEDRAFELYIKFKDSIVKTDQILTMLGVKTDKLEHEDKILELKAYATKDAKAPESEQQAQLLRFINVCEDKDLEYKFLIQEMIGIQYLKRIGSNIVYAETNEKIGESMEDAVLYFKNPKNSKEANILRHKYEVLIKRGIEYLPKEDKKEA